MATAVTETKAFDENDLRKKILAVHSDNSLGVQEKAKLVQKLMLQRWSNCGSSKENQSPTCCGGHGNGNSHNHNHNHDHGEEEGEASCKGAAGGALSLSTDSADLAAMGTEGCEHYKRYVMLQAKCCGKFFWCRFCHDNASNHKINRYETENMKCMVCMTVQPVADSCCNKACEKFEAPVHYFCGVCKFWDDDKNKNIYHCPHCNLCRIGKGLGIDYFHCMKCRACMPMKRKEHKCVERSLESDCPICHEYMFTSTSPVIFAKCGHCMHASCMDAYLRTNYRCPICCKSLGDMSTMFSRIDHKLATEVMPDQYKNTRSHIYCSDCEQKSVAPYHFLYHKCKGCGSYNTNVSSTYVDETPLAAAEQPAYRPVGDADIELEDDNSEDIEVDDVEDEEEEEEEEEEEDNGNASDAMDVDAVGVTEPEADTATTPVVSALPLAARVMPDMMHLRSRSAAMRRTGQGNSSWTHDLSLEDLLALEDLENSMERSRG